MCQAALESVKSYITPDDDDEKDSKLVPVTAADVPLGDGLAQQARLSIQSRRARLDAAIEEAETGRK